MPTVAATIQRRQKPHGAPDMRVFMTQLGDGNDTKRNSAAAAAAA